MRLVAAPPVRRPTQGDGFEDLVALHRLRSTWESLGRNDPLWAVLSDPARRNGKWDLQEFLETGREHGAVIRRMVEGAGLSLGERVLDFGCGVGRLSNALAEPGPSVVGVDIAASMIERARQIVRHPERISYVHYDGRSLPFPDDSFDSAVSLMVLQHARPVVQLGCLLELQRVVRPGGVLLLQIPSRQRQPEPLHPAAYRAGIELLDAPRTARKGQPITVRARVANRSEHVWPAGHRVNLGNHWLAEGGMLVRDDGRAALPAPMQPGEAVELALHATAPDVDGPAELELDLVQEFVTWWADVGGDTVRTTVSVRGDAEEPRAADPGARPATGSGARTPGEPEAVRNPAGARQAAEPGGDADGEMEMHGLHVDLVRSLFTHCGCRVVDAVPDTMAGDEWDSYTYLVQV
jgi:SAM-dependent methyltransferase